MDDDETNVMKILPDDRLYDKVTMMKGEQNTEECFAKMRWDERKEEETKKLKRAGEIQEP